MEYKFDIKMFAVVTVEASSEAEAKLLVEESLSCADANFGAWPNGDPILGEASIEGDPDLLEINGEAV